MTPSIIALVLIGGQAMATPASPAIQSPALSIATLSQDLGAQVPRWLAARHVAGVGVVVLRGGQIAWSGYYGEQGPGIPTSARTLFNGASLAKTITAEVTLRLASRGAISLDEPIAETFKDPRLATDPRYALLTPRLILSHRSGLLNWPYVYPDHKLKFVSTPGERFGYSGVAYEILGRFLERRIGADFETLAKREVFDPIGLKEISIARHPWMDSNVTTPMDDKGRYAQSYRTDAPENPDHPLHASWSAAADLFTSAPDYARFLLAVMRDDGLSPAVAKARRDLYSSFDTDPDWACNPALTERCPTQYGFGLGWMVFKYPAFDLITMGGNDSGENALAYFSTARPGDGVVVFMNGGGVASVQTELDIIDIIDPGQPLTAYYRQLIRHHLDAAAAQ